ncbi:MAG: beta-propeller fold lactonase family protein, partial [Bacteroidota bacterium]
FIKGGENGSILIPFHSERSDLIAHTNTDTTFGSIVLGSAHMPLGNVSLPMNQVRTMARWINEGAKSEHGKIPYATSLQGKMYVVNASADLLAVIDVKDKSLIRYVNIASSFSPPTSFGSPHHVHIDPKGKYFYVSLIELGEVWQYSVDSNKYVAKISDPLTMASPADLAISPSGDTIFVSNFLTAGSNRRITVLKATPTLHIIDVITMPFFCTTPHGLKRSHDGKRLYSTNTSGGNISEIYTHDFSYINVIALDTSGNLQNTTYDPYLIDISKNDSLMFVACKGSDEVRVIDRRKDSTKATKIISVGDSPLHLKLTPNEQEVWVCNQNSDNITIIKTSDYTTTTLDGVGRQPHGIEFTPDGQFAYITCENVANPDPPHHPTTGGKGVSFVIIYNVSSRQKIRAIEVAGWSQGIEFARASKN